MARNRPGWSATLALSLVLAGGCAADPPPEPPPEPGPVRQITDLSQISFPLEAYAMTPEEDLMLQRAVWVLTIDCLKRFGVDDVEPPPLIPTNRLMTSRRYGMLDLDGARDRGYRGSDPAADRADAEADAAAEADRVAGLAGVLLLGEGSGVPLPPETPVPLPPGAPRDGCLNEARRILADGGEMYDPNVLLQRADEALLRAERDERVQAAFAAWSACMADAGFTYAHPWEANNDDSWGVDVTDQERMVATADVTCKLETNLVGVWNAVDAAYQEQIIERDAELLNEMVENRRKLLDRAAEIVANSR